MSNKEDILKRYRANVREKYDMPDLSDIKAITYPDPLVQFIKMTESVGGHVIEVKEGQDINAIVKELYPDAKEIASNLPEITIATRNHRCGRDSRSVWCGRKCLCVDPPTDERESRLLYLRESGDLVAQESDCQQHA